MKRQAKLSQQQEHTSEQQSFSGGAQEFANAEEVLRYDAAQTIVPSGVARKLQASLGSVAASKTSWWKNLFGG